MAKIVQLNCHLFWGTVPAFFKRDLLYRDKERCTEICDWVAGTGATVALLSEVWSTAAKDTIQHRLSTMGYAYFYRAPHNPAGCAESSKLGPEFLVASKIPIVDTCVKFFSRLKSWDAYSQKLVLGVHFANLFVCFTHFDSTDAACRTSNLNDTKAFIAANSRGKPVVLAGDFNIPELNMDYSTRHQEYAELVTSLQPFGLRDSYRLHNPSIVDMPGWTADYTQNPLVNRWSPGNCMKMHIDYFFCSNSINTASCEVVPINISDHYPVVLTIN